MILFGFNITKNNLDVNPGFQKGLLTLCFSCSPDSINEQLPEIEENSSVPLTPSVTEFTVDMPFEVKVQSNEAIYDIIRIFENGS